MEKDILKKANELQAKIEKLQVNIDLAKTTQAEVVKERLTEWHIPNFSKPMTVPSTLFKLFGMLIMAEDNKVLQDLLDEFEQL